MIPLLFQHSAAFNTHKLSNSIKKKRCLPFCVVVLGCLALLGCGPHTVGSFRNYGTPSLFGELQEFPAPKVTNFTIVSMQGRSEIGPSTIKDYVSGEGVLPLEARDDDMGNALWALYERNLFQPLWHDGKNWLPAALETAQILRNARRHGLFPQDYLPSGLQLPNFSASNAASIAQTDIILSSGLLRYIVDVEEGRFAPTKRIDPIARFLAGAESGDYVGWLNNLGADSWIYRRMTNAVGQHDKLDRVEFDRYRVTMERLRWDAPALPLDKRYVLLNVGSAEVWAMNKLHLDLGVNTVVGRQSRRTPIRDDAIVNLKFSPDWTAPYSIVKKDLVQLAKNDPGFVNTMSLEIYRNGKRVDPFDINWANINVYDYVWKQPPGSANVLGGVRFSLENSQSIYMHDSPDMSLFDDAFRSKSSGCIRVGASDELALWLLQGENVQWTMEDVKERMERGKTNYVKLKRKMPVKTIYTTAWVSHNGRLVTFPDTYGENTDLRRRMGLPIEEVDDKGVRQVSAASDLF